MDMKLNLRIDYSVKIYIKSYDTSNTNNNNARMYI